MRCAIVIVIWSLASLFLEHSVVWTCNLKSFIRDMFFGWHYHVPYVHLVNFIFFFVMLPMCWNKDEYIQVSSFITQRFGVLSATQIVNGREFKPLDPSLLMCVCVCVCVCGFLYRDVDATSLRVTVPVRVGPFIWQSLTVSFCFVSNASNCKQ